MTGSRRKTRDAWPTARRAVQYVTFLGFLILFVGAQRLRLPASWAALPQRLDPLVVLASSLASRSVVAGSALALLTVASALLFGRAWCGWVCPLGTCLDLFSLRRWRGQRPAPSESLRSLKHVLLITILASALLGSLTLLILDPLTILYRGLTVGIWPALDRGLTAVETWLYDVPLLRSPISTLDSLLRPEVFPATPQSYRLGILYAGVLLAVIGLSVFAERFWCRYLCPLGGFLGLVGKVALVRREVASSCSDCGRCVETCPTGTIRADRGFASDPGECTLCMDCLRACARGEVRFRARVLPAVGLEYDPGRREVLAALGAAAGGVALLKVESPGMHARTEAIRPPGSVEADLLSRCIRCSLCVRACPTGALQPALAEAGLEGLWTPIVVPRLGYCDYSCNACGQACPVQAIPPLTLDAKRLRVIGTAAIDETRCIAWAGFGNCIVCEEMCPLPEKAVVLEVYDGSDPLGEHVSILRPHVVGERCIGCGICEYKCPVVGEAAIRIYRADQGQSL